MSDFIFSYTIRRQGELGRYIQSIYHADPPEVQEFHGPWGSLAVSRNVYSGFQVLENEQHVFVVVGGPVLYFRNNDFLTGSDPVVGTGAIYERWLSGKMKWDEDLSGPFAILAVDKARRQVTYITDLLLSIPVYRYREGNRLLLGTHIDAVARAAGQSEELDTVSLIDFVLNGVVTYPYTVYKKVVQVSPASIATEATAGLLSCDGYWVPQEVFPYSKIDDAATALREALEGYVKRITENMEEIGQFLSGGEDSRALVGVIPRRLRRDAFIFLDSMNREGRIAEKAARAYGANFHVGLRSPTHYLEILEEASDLVGIGHQYLHAHSLGFEKVCGLREYAAVFGGYSADVLLKGLYARKLRGSSRFCFVPEIFVHGETRTAPVRCALFAAGDLAEIDERRLGHMRRVLRIRPISAHEWFVIWPSTMRCAIPYLYCNRRLFRSYEAFLCNDVVKISATVPTTWKLNRRLFNSTVRPYLEPAKWLVHGDGRYPYFPWWFNMPVQCCVRSCRHVVRLLGVARRGQGPWFEWDNVVGSTKWGELVERYGKNLSRAGLMTGTELLDTVFEGGILTSQQKLNLLQVAYMLEKVAK